MKSDFRTILSVSKSDITISHHNPILLTGSCFSENIGQYLKRYKFKVVPNPMGISYNPISIHRNLSFKEYNGSSIKKNEGVYFDHQFHSFFNKTDKADFIEEVKHQGQHQQEFLKNTNFLIITYGTAWVYELSKTGEVVSNCHKQNASLFNKRLLEQKEIVSSWADTIQFLRDQYAIEHFIFTVSPVRHLKDGVRENQLSKATLHLAAEEICNKYQNCHYFPSYEIVMDDLRDYRYYKDDFLHPNHLAIDYIWKLFSTTYFSEKTILLNREIQKINQSMTHKAFHPNGEKHQQFLKQLLKRVQLFQKENKINLTKEIETLQERIV